MATEIVTVTWCDPCLAVDAKVEAHNYTITLDWGQRILALCEPHHKEYLEPLAGLLKELSQPSDQWRPSRSSSSSSSLSSGRAVVCMECGRELADRTSLRKHITRVHDMVMPAYQRKHGIDVSTRTEPSSQTCPMCEQVYSWDLGNNRPRQALSIHLRRQHNSSLGEHNL